MNRSLIISLALLLALASAALASAADGLFDLSTVNVGDMSEGQDAEYEIEIRNISNSPLNIDKVDTSCGCTVVDAPSQSIAPGETAKVKVTIDTRGKMGDISKELKLYTSGSDDPHVLTVRGKVEHFGEGVPDPGVIFRGDCAECHVGRDIGNKQGEILYNSVCFLCHKSGLSPEAAGSDRLVSIIAEGIPGTSMPGFAESSGGPLSMEQIRSLSEHIRDKSVR